MSCVPWLDGELSGICVLSLASFKDWICKAVPPIPSKDDVLIVNEIVCQRDQWTAFNCMLEGTE